MFTTGSLDPCNSECGLTSCMGLVWELVGKAASQAHLDPLNQNLHFKKIPQYAHSSLRSSVLAHPPYIIQPSNSVYSHYNIGATIQWSDPIPDSPIALTMSFIAEGSGGGSSVGSSWQFSLVSFSLEHSSTFLAFHDLDT